MDILQDVQKQSLQESKNGRYLSRDLGTSKGSSSSEYYTERIDDSSRPSGSGYIADPFFDIVYHPKDYLQDGIRGRLATVALHSGERNGRQHSEDYLAIPASIQRSYTFKNTEQIIAHRKGLYEPGASIRLDTLVAQVEEKIKLLENSQSCALINCGSPHTILAYLIQSFVPKGGRIILCHAFLSSEVEETLKVLDVDITFLSIKDFIALEKEIAKGNVFMVICQTSPVLNLGCPDLIQLAKICKDNQILGVADNTVATPINCNPLSFGMDLVVHNDTQYLSGQRNLQLGAVCGQASYIEKIKGLQNIFTGKFDNQAVSCLSQGLQTLEMRVKQQNANAQEIANRLLDSPAYVWDVQYQGYKNYSGYQTSEAQLYGYGNIISFDIKSDAIGTSKFIDNLTIPYICSQVGGNCSTIQQPQLLRFGNLTEWQRKQLNIHESMVMMSVGLENIEDLWQDILKAFSKIFESSSYILD